MIIFLCKKCGAQHTVPNEWAGKKVKCPCGEKNRLPAPPELDPESEQESGGYQGVELEEEETELPAISSVSRMQLKRRMPWWVPVLKYLSSVVVAILIVLAYQHYVLKQPIDFFFGEPSDPVEEPTPSPQDKKPVEPSAQPGPKQPDPNAVAKNSEKPEDPGYLVPEPLVEKTPENTTPQPPGPEQPPQPATEPASPSVPVEEVAEKVPVPADSELKSPRTIIVEVFGDKMRAAKTPEAKAFLITELISTAATTPDPAQKYALFQQAQKLAIKARELQLCFQIMEGVAQSFEVDQSKIWSEVLVKFVGQVDEATLKKLVEADLAASREPTKRLEAADLWFELSKEGPLARKRVAKNRAALHYQAALPILQGDKKQHAFERIQECSKGL
ncbi:MAG: hypothetical protein PVH19_03240 [Planctomycetia bacterium]|jgi:hypothetical protein